MNDDTARMTTAQVLVGMARQAYVLGRTPQNEPFAITYDVPHLIRPLKGKGGVRPELAAKYNGSTSRVAPPNALTAALETLTGYALQQPPRDVYLRTARVHTTGNPNGDTIWVDLGDSDGRVIRLDAGGWDLTTTNVPVLFRRTNVTAPFPTPVQQGGDVELLWNHLNVDPLDQPLVLAWLVDVLTSPTTPKPILAVTGEQGTGKSTACRRLVDLVDPSQLGLRPPPREKDWPTHVKSSYVIAIDNMSVIPPGMSDVYCRTATGDGQLERELYTNSDLIVTSYTRSLILNGIEWGAVAGDLGERMVPIQLAPIEPTARRTDTQIDAAWRVDLPVILGGLLDTCVTVLSGHLDGVTLREPPRMADYAETLAIIDAMRGTDGMRRYREHLAQLAAGSLTTNPFIQKLVLWARPFHGPAHELLELLALAPGEQPPKGWPSTALNVTNLLRRHAMSLRQQGWQVNDGKDTHTKVTVWDIDPPRTGNR